MAVDFWTSNTMEPKRGFRFLINWNIDNKSLQFVAKSVSRPSYTVSSNPHKFFNHTFHYPGRVEWGTITMTLVDALSPNGAELFMNYLNNIGYKTSAVQADITDHTITKESATTHAAGLVIEEQGSDANGNASTSGKWTLKNAFITEVNFGEHSYDSEDMIDIQLTIQYDWANYENLRATTPA
jgi:hypothetical protein